MSKAQALVVPAVKQHTATVIFFHGLGDSGAGWVDLANNWRRRGKFDYIKFVFPNAPNIRITANFGMAMPAWFDIKSFDDVDDASQDERGILDSRSSLSKLIALELSSGIPSTRIVLGGFSQGGAMALITGLTSPRPLAGIVGLSCWLPIANRVPDLIKDATEAEGYAGGSKETPVWLGHGKVDPLVKYEWVVKSKSIMEALGWKVTMTSYEGLQHSAAPEEIDDLEKFLEGRVPEKGAVGTAGSKT